MSLNVKKAVAYIKKTPLEQLEKEGFFNPEIDNRNTLKRAMDKKKK